MSRVVQSQATLVTPNGGTDTPALAIPQDCAAIRVYAPATLTASNVVQLEPTATGTSWVTGQDPAGTDMTVAAAKAPIFRNPTGLQMRIHAPGAEGGARSFVVVMEIRP